MTQVKILLEKTKQIFLPKETVFDFTDIYECWLQGKCTTEYLHNYCLKQIANGFINETERRKK
jgi:hypothetical protein